MTRTIAGIHYQIFSKIGKQIGLPTYIAEMKFQTIKFVLIISKISESLLLKKLLRKIAVAGMRVQKQETTPVTAEIKDEQKEKKIYDFFRKNRLHIFLWGRELLWKMVNWKSKELKDFIKEFNPDVIYSPSYDLFTCMTF